MPSDLEVERVGQVAAALAALAEGCETAADVAAKLLTAGCKGEQAGCYTCPTAVWLARNLPDADRLYLAVDSGYVTARWLTPDGLNRRSGVPATDYEIWLDPVPLPPVLRAFVDDFDDGVFPELDKATT